jgi:cell division protein FtsZ
VLDRLVLDGVTGVELIALNTDVQSLLGSVVERKIQLGPSVTRGLGTGGDPELGTDAAQESMAEIVEAVDGAEIVFVLAGLGGGTACGALPAVAHAARERGARVIVVVTLPLSFEGKRRVTQAAECLASLRRHADLLVCIENDRMGELASARGGVQEAFGHIDQALSQCVRALAATGARRGPLHIGFDEIAAVFHEADLRGLFGYGEASGDNRAHAAITALLKSPLLDRGRHLEEIHSAVINIAGGTDMTFFEVQVLAEEVRKHLPAETELYFGISVDPALEGRMAVTVLGALPAMAELPPVRETVRLAAPVPVPAPAPVAVAVQEPEEEEVEVLEEAEVEDFEVGELEPEAEEEEEIPVAQETQSLFAEGEIAEDEPAAEEPEPVRPRMRPLVAPMGNVRRVSAQDADADAAPLPKAESEESAKARQLRQSQMQFDAVNRGRFEKSEPTIIDGQDLDVPTFLRRKLKLGQ